MSYNERLQSNNIDLQALIAKANSLPEAGIKLPELSEPAIEDEVFLNQEYIDSAGNKKTGTFTIDNELSVQEDVIAQIVSALEGKASGGGNGVEWISFSQIPTTLASDPVSTVYYYLELPSNSFIGWLIITFSTGGVCLGINKTVNKELSTLFNFVNPYYDYRASIAGVEVSFVEDTILQIAVSRGDFNDAYALFIPYPN